MASYSSLRNRPSRKVMLFKQQWHYFQQTQVMFLRNTVQYRDIVRHSYRAKVYFKYSRCSCPEIEVLRALPSYRQLILINTEYSSPAIVA